LASSKFKYANLEAIAFVNLYGRSAPSLQLSAGTLQVYHLCSCCWFQQQGKSQWSSWSDPDTKLPQPVPPTAQLNRLHWIVIVHRCTSRPWRRLDWAVFYVPA